MAPQLDRCGNIVSEKTTTETKLTAEIERFGLQDTATNCNGLAVYFDDDLPVGFVRIDGDGSGSQFGLADKAIEELASRGVSGDFEEDQQEFYDALVAAGFSTSRP